ncbi:hypothetical protein C8J57DRAFT_1235836 [Mycena rebaudengoi]|nr:hypothetical protein C8J57DRAFT_1235836 [Mycena rebaudengoi]
MTRSLPDPERHQFWIYIASLVVHKLLCRPNKKAILATFQSICDHQLPSGLLTPTRPASLYRRGVHATQYPSNSESSTTELPKLPDVCSSRVVPPPRSPSKAILTTFPDLWPPSFPGPSTFPRLALFSLRKAQGVAQARVNYIYGSTHSMPRDNADPTVAADSGRPVEVNAGENPGTLAIDFSMGRSLTLRHLDLVIEGGFEVNDIEFQWTNPDVISRLSVKIYVDMQLADKWRDIVLSWASAIDHRRSSSLSKYYLKVEDTWYGFRPQIPVKDRLEVLFKELGATGDIPEKLEQTYALCIEKRQTATKSQAGWNIDANVTLDYNTVVAVVVFLLLV